MQKILGVLGGMGPEATADFFQRVIANTPANSDQDHIRIVIDNNPAVPDRTKSILEQGETPVPVLTSMAKKLENHGASLLTMPCNTAHYYHKDISQQINIPLLNMISLTTKFISQKFKASSRVGIMATKGTLQTEIYQQELKKENLIPIIPDKKQQNDVMEAIYKIKKNNKDRETKNLIKHTIKELENKNVRAIIAGCTELPLLPLEKFSTDSLIVNPAEILAQKAVEKIKK